MVYRARLMAAKVHACIAGLGVLLMLLAGGLGAQMLLSDDESTKETVDTAAHATTSPSGPASAAAPSSSPTPSRTPTPTPTPVLTAPRTTPPAPTTTTTSAAPPPAPTLGPWTAVWADEFDGTASQWSAADGLGGELACATSRPENVLVSGGVLTLRAIAEPVSCGGQDRQYSTASLTSGRSFTYGAFEVRAKGPGTPASTLGLWPAFWLSPADGGAGEFDVVQCFGGPSTYAAPVQSLVAGASQQHSGGLSGHPGDGFHTYRTEWDPGVLRWYVDGTLVWTRDASMTPGFDTAFARPYVLHLNFQVGGAAGTPDASTALPADFQVDYVRVYQRAA